MRNLLKKMEKQGSHFSRSAGLRLALLFLVTIAVLVSNAAIVIFLLFAISLLGLVCSRISLPNVSRLIKISFPLIFFALLANIFVFDGTGDASIFGSFGLTFVGFERAGIATMRILTLVFSIFWLASFASYTQVSFLLSRALKPLRSIGANSKAIVEVFSLTLLFLPLCFLELENLRAAHILRGVEMKKAGPVQKLASFASTLVSLVVLLFKRAELRALALKSRGF